MPPTDRRSGLPRRCVPAAGAVLAVVLAGCAALPVLDAGVPVPGTTPPPTTAAVSGDGTPATTKVPVHWIGAGDSGRRLFREFRDHPAESEAVDPIGAAAQLMTDSAPADPDYRTLWLPAGTVGSSMSPDGTITVDLPAEAFAPRLTEEEGRLALQQLAHTVTAAADTAGLLPTGSEPTVTVLVDGEPGRAVFGSVRLDEPVRPDEALTAPVWLATPQQGTRSPGTLTVSGRLLEGARGCRWTVEERDDPSGVPLSSGIVASGPHDGEPLSFEAEVLLPPGEYVVTVVARDEEGETVRDDKEVVVLTS